MIVLAVVALGGIAALAAALASGADPAPPATANRADAPDIVLVDGKISTLDASSSTVEALAIRGGEIIATGRSGPIQALARQGTLMIDLNGRRVLPGLLDGHLHGLRNGYHCFTQTVRLDNVFSRAQALQLYAAKGAELADDRWVWTTVGWTVRQLDQPGMFTLAELDAALPANPAYVLGSRFSGVQVNTRALQLLGLTAGSPGVEVDASGRPTGRLTGSAQTAAGAAIMSQIDAHSIDEQATCLADFIRTANSLGLTGWNDPEGNQQPFNTAGSCSEFAVGLHDHQPVIQLWRDGRLNARVTYHLMNNFSGLSQVLQDHRHPVPFMGDDMLRYLGVGEEVLCPGNQPPPNPAEYQAIANFLAADRSDARACESTRRRDDPEHERCAWRRPHAALQEHVRQRHPPVPLHGRDERRALSAVRRPLVRDQRLTREQALRAKTVGCAWNLTQDGRLGTLEVGKHADLIVLSDDYFSVPVDDIRTLRSVLTVVGGRIVFADAEFKRLDGKS
jgi:predicted amidohydrolase YtcJ